MRRDPRPVVYAFLALYRALQVAIYAGPPILLAYWLLAPTSDPQLPVALETRALAGKCAAVRSTNPVTERGFPSLSTPASMVACAP